MKPRNASALPMGILASSLLLSGSSFAMTELASGYMAEPPADHHGEGRCGFARMDRDGDGKISREEFAAAHDGSDERFAAHDLNGDGHVSREEMDQHHANMHPQRQESATDEKKDAEGKCGEGKCGGGKCGGSR